VVAYVVSRSFAGLDIYEQNKNISSAKIARPQKAEGLQVWLMMAANNPGRERPYEWDD